MSFFEYPYVIITILAMLFLLACIIGLYFTMKSARAAKESAGEGFSTLGRIEHAFERAGNLRLNRCVLYISVPLDGVKRLYSEAKAYRMHEQIKKILFRYLCPEIGGEICLYGKANFIALNDLEEEKLTQRLDQCSEEINKVFAKNGAVGVVHINFGYCLTRSNEVSFETILARAKQACSMADDKKVLYCRWDRNNGKEFERKISIENHIENEIDSNRFFLQYQPIIDAKTDKVIGAEVLSRLNSSTEGVLPPDQFLAAVNNVGLNLKFDYYVFEKNCKWIANDKENRMKYVYTINFSRHTLCDPELAENITRIVEKYGIDYSCIAVEILEDTSLNDKEKAVMSENLTALKEKGIALLLDDFGSGYTSLGDLAEFDVSIIKIDRTITQNTGNEKGFLLLSNIIRTAKDLGFRTLCEGVETEEQKRLAAEAGCDLFQGYYFYRPMPVAQLKELLEAQ